MNSESKMSWETTKHLANDLVFKCTGKFLSDIEVEVLQGSWEGNNYEYIAEKTRRSSSYINTNVGNSLWKKLSEALGEEVSKKNFRQALKREWEKRTNIFANSTTSEFPFGPVALDSPFYVKRPSIEADAYREILKPGSIIRIKAPKRMGKTSLLNRILAYVASRNYQSVRLNLRQAEKTLFTNLDKFLRWFCFNISRGLNLEPRLDDYWDEDTGSKVNCTEYFERHILSQVSSLVIGLDEIDAVFSYPDIAEDFLGLLREFHEEAMIKVNWQRLRLVMVYSTEIYIPLNINQSPFNVGLPLKLPLFNQQQVQDLAGLYGLAWASGESAQKLIAMVGGHPYLVQLALYHLSRQEVTLEHLLQDAPTHAGIYSDHLRHCLGCLQQQPELAAALKQIVTAETSVQLPSVQVYQLDSMGLIQLDGNYVQPSCELYRQYFCTNLP